MSLFWNDEDYDPATASPQQKDVADNFSIFGDTPNSGVPNVDELTPDAIVESVVSRYRPTPRPPATVGDQVIGAAKTIGRGALDAFSTVVGAPKRGIDWLARQGAGVLVGPQPDTTTAGQMLRESLYPENPEHGGLLEHRIKPQDEMSPDSIAAAAVAAGLQSIPGIAPVVRGLEASGSTGRLPRAVIGDVGQFAAEMGLDPVTYGAGLIGAPSKVATLSQKILTKYGPVAPEIAARLAPNLIQSPARKVAEKVMHRAFQAQMGIGALEQGKQAVELGLSGDVDGAVRAAVQAGISGAMVAGPPILKGVRERKTARALNAAREARKGELGSAFAPDEPLPIDALPEDLREPATSIAVELGRRSARDPNFNPISAPPELPPELEPHRALILQQAAHEAASIAKGHEMISKWGQEYGDQGNLDVQKIDDPSGDPSSFLLLQRAKVDGKTRVVGGAQVEYGALKFITGGKGVESPVSARPLYETLDTLGVRRSEFLSPMGLRARRKFSEEVGAGEEVARRAVAAQEQARVEAPLDMEGAEPAYTTERPTPSLASDPNYTYHATTLDRAHEILSSGKLSPHRPNYGTDQSTWPDRSTESRSYFTDRADTAWQFAPEEGQPVVLRIRKDSHPFRRESTGDTYTTKPVPADKLEVLTSDGTWKLLRDELVKGEPAYSTEKPPAEVPAPVSREVGPGFYSQLRNVVDDPRVQSSQRGGDWLNYLSDPKRGVKASELEWTGLKEYLAGRSGEKVTKKEVQEYLNQNEVRVEEVTKGGADELANADDIAQQEFGVNYDELTTPEQGIVRDRVYGGVRAPSGGPTKFSQWQEPGGSSYRELLLTLGDKKPIPTPGRYEARELPSPPAARPGIWRVFDTQEDRFSGWVTDQQYEAAARAKELNDAGVGELPELRKKERSFTAGHYSEPNVLAHVRFNDRVDAEGKKVLFVEEIQSDWGQKGRKEGFANKLTPDEEARLQELGLATNKRRQAELMPVRTYEQSLAREQAFAEARAMDEEANQLLRKKSGHPSAPFVTSTPEWTSLAAKRILKYAADNGYDRVAWTTGEMQANRYDLSKQISKVKLVRSSGGIGAPEAGPFERGTLKAYDHQGHVVVDKFISDPSQLADYIGKDAAEKLVNAPERIGTSQESTTGSRVREISGLDLKVGGEGMKGYYDEMVPQVFGKLGKKYGAKVGETQLETGETTKNIPQDELKAEARRQLEDGDTGASYLLSNLARGREVTDAQTVLRNLRSEDPTVQRRYGVTPDSYRIVEDFIKQHSASRGMTVHSIDLPESLRSEASTRGFPLFKTEAEKAAAAATGTPAPTPAPVPLRDLLLRLYPDNSYIRERDNRYTITLPDKREIHIRPGVDSIEIDTNAFQEAHEGRAPAPGERAVGVTYRLPNSALVEMVQGADPGVLYHEHWHVLRHLGDLSREQIGKLETLYGSGKAGEEAQAEAFSKWAKADRPRHTIFTKIWEAIKTLADFVTQGGVSPERQAEKVFGEVAEKGLAPAPVPDYLRPRKAGPYRGAEAVGPAFATAPSAPPEGPPSPSSPLTPSQPSATLPVREILGERAPYSGQSIDRTPAPDSIERATGNPPRVEQRVEDLKSSISEQRALGIPAKDLVLDRDTRRTWKSIEPEVQAAIRDWDDDKLFATLKRRHLDDYEVQALDAVVRGRREAKDLAREEYLSAKGDPSKEPAAWGEYVRSIASYAALERANVNDGTGLARALAARARIMSNPGLPTDRAFLKQVFREIEGISDKEAGELLRLFESGDPNLSTALRAHFTGNAKKFWTLWRANLIGIPSEFANNAGNIITQGVELGDKAAASGIDWVLSKLRRTGRRERYVAEVGAEIGGMLNALPRALLTYANERGVQVYKRAWSGESRKILPGTPFEHQISPFKSKLGRLAATPLDALGVADDAAQSIIYPGELAARATRLAIQRTGKARGEEMYSEAQRILADVSTHPERYEDLIKSARDASQRRVYREKPWAIVQHLQQMEKSYPWMAIVLPFVKTPANIARYSIRHLPLGLPSPEVYRAIRDFHADKISQGEFADILAPRITGTIMFGAVAGLAKAGLITGGGPSDPKEKRNLLATGWQPYSFRLTLDNGKHVYVPYSRFDPVSNTLGIAADLYSLNDSKDLSDAVSRGVGSVMSNITNKTYLRGLGDAATAYTDPKQFLASYVSGSLNALTPSALDKLAIAIDPKFRDVRPTDRGILGLPKRMANTLLSQLPFASETLPSRYSATGEPSMRPGGGGIAGGVARFLLPSIPTYEKPGTELEALFAKLHYVPSAPRPFLSVSGIDVPLRREDLEVYQRADRDAAQEARRLLYSPSFAHLPDTIEEGQGGPSKESTLKRIFQKHRDSAKTLLWRSSSFRTYARGVVPMGKLPA
jgi:hypothetical protein